MAMGGIGGGGGSSPNIGSSFQSGNQYLLQSQQTKAQQAKDQVAALGAGSDDGSGGSQDSTSVGNS